MHKIWHHKHGDNCDVTHVDISTYGVEGVKAIISKCGWFSSKQLSKTTGVLGTRFWHMADSIWMKLNSAGWETYAGVYKWTHL